MQGGRAAFLPTEKPRSREELLQRWREQRAAKQQQNSTGTSARTGVVNHNHNHNTTCTANLRKKIKVKVRRSSNPTPPEQTPAHGSAPSDKDKCSVSTSKKTALRLYEQGTVASRLKSKSHPVSSSVNDNPEQPHSNVYHHQQHPSTLPKARKELLKEQQQRQQKIAGKVVEDANEQHRRKSEPSQLLQSHQTNYTNNENQSNQQQPRPQPQPPRESFSSTRLFQESPIRKKELGDEYDFGDDDSSTNLLIIDQHRDGDDERMPLSPLSCSFQSSVFGSPPTPASLQRRLSRLYDRTSLEPKQLLSDEEEDHEDKKYNIMHNSTTTVPESLIQNSVSPIDKNSTYMDKDHSKVAEADESIKNDNNYDDDDDVRDGDGEAEGDDSAIDEYDVVHDLENASFDCGNVTNRSKSQRSMMMVSVGHSHCSLSYGSDDCLGFDDWDDLSSPTAGGIIDLPASPSQRLSEDEIVFLDNHNNSSEVEEDAAVDGGGAVDGAVDDAIYNVREEQSLDHDEKPLKLEDRGLDPPEKESEESLEERGVDPPEQECSEFEVEDRGVDPPETSPTKDVPVEQSISEKDHMEDDLEDDDSFDWRHNLSPDTPSPRNSLIAGQSKRRMDPRILVLPSSTSTTPEEIEPDCSPRSDILSQQSTPSSSLNSDLEQEQEHECTREHHRRVAATDTTEAFDRLVLNPTNGDHSSDMDVDEDSGTSRSDDDSHSSSVISDVRDEVEDDDNDAEQRSHVCDRFVRVEGRTVLQPVREQITTSLRTPQSKRGEANLSCRRCKAKDETVEELQYQLGELQWRAETAESDKQKYQNQIYAFRTRYESRVTPFRDVFEEMSRLRKENQKLLIENKETKATLHSNIADLQKQMTEALTITLNKKITLETKLEEAEKYILRLESERRNVIDGRASLGQGLPDEAISNSRLRGGEPTASTTLE